MIAAAEFAPQSQASRVPQPEGEATLASLFTEAAERHGQRIAISHDGAHTTYAQLAADTAKVAAALRGFALPTDALIAILTDRTPVMVSAMTGVVTAGAAYLPLDPGHPAARLSETLADAAPVALLMDRANLAKFGDLGQSVLLLEDVLAGPDTVAAGSRAAADDLAYVIYTSGSTGKPKGVMVTHRNVVRLFEQTRPWFAFDEHDVWTMFHSFAFDFSVWEMWGALLHGGRLVLVPFAVSRSPEEFLALLAAERVTVLNQTPTAFSMLVTAEGHLGSCPLALRYIVFGGEALNLRVLLPWIARHGDAQPELVNMYGITETTVHVTYRRIRTRDAEAETESLIGEPIPDLKLHLLDANLQPVPDGEVGEMFISGPGVTRGYLKRPELTTERFRTDVLSVENAAKVYRSGDLARRRADGELVYLGRNDQQVKINGFRIELGEVEAVLTACAGVAQVCAVAQTDAVAGTRLVAYFVPVRGGADQTIFARFAEQHLPTHLRPSVYVPIEALPLNVNGKVDRKALPPPESMRPSVSAPQANDPSLAATLAKLWASVLGVPAVGVDEGFFEAGGTSLSLIALRAALREQLDLDVPVTWLFEHTTVRALAAKLTAHAAAATTGAATQTNAARQREALARMRAQRISR